MRRIQFASILLMIMLIGVAAASGMFDDIKSFQECKYCGMKRENFAFSRMLVVHKDGKSVGVCSINCAAIDYLSRIDDSPVAFKVGDFNTQKLIEAKKAHWVLGGDEQGVMAARAKWAFESISDAENFMKEHGGELITFEEAMSASYVDMYEDMRKLQMEKRKYAKSRDALDGDNQ